MDVILRHRVERDYTVLTNKVLRDTRLSWAARGLLAYLLHLPPNFLLSLSFLLKQSPTGRDATRTLVRELQRHGYIFIRRDRDPANGCFIRTVWIVTDSPVISPQTGFPTADNPTTEDPLPENPTSENPPLINTTDQKELTRTTTTAQAAKQHDAVVVGDQLEVLDFPPVFSGERRDSALQIIESCPEQHRQNVLYEVAGIIERGRLRGSLIGLLQGLARKAREGAFVPSYGISYAAKRRQEREARARADAEAALRKQSDPVRDREAARNALATIRNQICGEAR